MKNLFKKLLVLITAILILCLTTETYKNLKTGDYVGATIVLFIMIDLIVIDCIVIVRNKTNKNNKNAFNAIDVIEKHTPNNVCKNYETIHNVENQNIYMKKKLMTHCELNFYYKILNIIDIEKYILQAQIPLSSIIYKTENSYYANELYRTIDFGIFDKKGEIKVLIELNDNTHNIEKRRNRDIKVKRILEEVNIPLITLWTNQTNFSDYIAQRLSLYIDVDYV